MLEQQRHRGRRSILRTIRKLSPVARIDIADQTGISRATVTTITAELLRAGLIEEVAAPVADTDKEQARGRPRVGLKIAGAAHLVAGLKVAHSSVTAVVQNFEGTVVHEAKISIKHSSFSPEALLEVIDRALEAVLLPLDKTVAELSGIGIALAGIVDVDSGLVHWSPTLDARNVYLRDQIEAHLKIPIFLDNDANLVAMAEKAIGVGQDYSDFIVVTIDSGVGMGIVIGNEIYRGTRGCGAEFGHTKVQLQGALCRCGQRGCLEAYVADYALLREASVTQGLGAEGQDVQHVQALLEKARQGDPMAKSIVDRAGRMFAMGLANIINIFDPQVIVLCGERVQFDHLYAEDVIENIKNSIVQVDQSPPEIVVHSWGDQMWAMGAAAYALEGVEAVSLKKMVDHEV